jgi:hypothetical protein
MHLLKNGVPTDDNDSPRNFGYHLADKNLEIDFEDYSAVAELRFNNLNNMSKILGRLMNKGCVDVECQTDEISFADEDKPAKEEVVEEDPNKLTFNVETAPNTPAENPNHYYHLPL